MNKESRPNTYLRIINAALILFNEYGERNISTNHIANHLGISPGNLYYHFSNKDEIIIQLFKRYSEAVFNYLTQTQLPNNITKIVEYMKGIYDIMWEYRFFFSDVNALLVRSNELLGEHSQFTQGKISPLLFNLLTQLQDFNMIEIDEIGKKDLVINMWIISKYWFDFDSSMQGRTKISSQAKQRGVYQTLSLLRPYLRQSYRAEFDQSMMALNLNNH